MQSGFLATGGNYLSLGSELRGMLSGLAVAATAVLVSISIDFEVPGQQLSRTLRFHIVLAFLPMPVLLAIARAQLRAMAMFSLLLLGAGQGSLIVAGQSQRRAPLEALGVEPSSGNCEIVCSPDEQVATFLALAPRHTSRVLLLALWTGQRQSDLLWLSWSD